MAGTVRRGPSAKRNEPKGLLAQAKQKLTNAGNYISGFLFGNDPDQGQKPASVKKANVFNSVRLANESRHSKSARNDKENLANSLHELSIDGDSPLKSKRGGNFAYEP